MGIMQKWQVASKGKNYIIIGLFHSKIYTRRE